MGLKTLKDFEKNIEASRVSGGEGIEVTSFFSGKEAGFRELKDEAIKWLIDQQEWFDVYNKEEVISEKREYHRGVVDFIKRFFNLTKEELK